MGRTGVRAANAGASSSSELEITMTALEGPASVVATTLGNFDANCFSEYDSVAFDLWGDSVNFEEFLAEDFGSDGACEDEGREARRGAL